MSVLLVVNTAPAGSEGPYNAFRLADALALRDHYVGVLLMGDAVRSARARQDPRGARGLTAAHRVPGVRVATIHDLAAATARSGKVISF
jgi:sulfur relay (sulfurtransferase) complex TusBCD TusD component (DsrE family)